MFSYQAIRYPQKQMVIHRPVMLVVLNGVVARPNWCCMPTLTVSRQGLNSVVTRSKGHEEMLYFIDYMSKFCRNLASSPLLVLL